MGKHEWSEAQQEEQGDEAVEVVESPRESRVRRMLLAAFVAAFNAPIAVDLTDDVLRTIGSRYASLCFALGAAPHPANAERLRDAMDLYVVVHPASESLLFPGCPF